MSFSELTLSSALIDAIPSEFSHATHIQTLAIPAITAQHDVLALAQTGSGKTLAFGLGLIEQLLNNEIKQALILVPTRELAKQVTETIDPIVALLGYSVAVVCGGEDVEPQVGQLNAAPEIVVATPGRLLDIMNKQLVDTQRIETVVLDEVDRLLDMGFWPDIQSILNGLSNRKQTLMFSATLPEQLEAKVTTLLNNPIRVVANKTNSVVEQIAETLYLVNKGSKANVLIKQITEHQWPQVLVFIGARDNADALCKKLNKAGITSGALHGNKEQTERERTLQAFKQGEIQVLIATDILARGIHVDDLPVVINYELPSDPSVYVHRVGRTARAGKTGQALSLVCHGETEYLEAIRQLTSRSLVLEELADFPVTDKPSTGESKRPKRDKQANRRTNKKTRASQFKSKKR
ncbi:MULTISPECIES: DEAD/DEAH box helicase [Vibrio]|uniref:ATP-dependent helicase n=1 Tax=Vibrio mediterranei TaxID=689 RepID=A0ABX5DBP7_9VIBR|nr:MULTISPECIES: DEAD/DEAH box helicase [Vibrio]KFA96441.1 DEAD/DEAH box helicase [Vibrio sp. ER1A]MCF4175126.1 DEAD/DEAH box helicase [Vibrio sp. McD22-P3]MCG9657861.1 DEAD/DEAH box helicase [Vibrio mediterranei]MCG9662373.1 DEAD/DEAH box helicase [Vibrio mediterranei]MCG9787827.1 DEAD/DEAH box helicase [Vibrio mediterranei]